MHCLPEQEACITVDALKNHMTIMTDIIIQQVTEQMRKTVEAVNFTRPLPAFDYVPTTRCELSHRHAPAGKSDRPTREEQEVSGQNHDRSLGVDTRQAREVAPGRLVNSATASMPYPMTTTLEPHNARKYCEFHEQKGHATAKCKELKKALHEHAGKGQIGRFLKRRPRFLRKECDPVLIEPREEESSMEIVATIAGGYVEGVTRTGDEPKTIIWLPLRLGDKSKVQNVEVDLLVVDVPTAYNVNLGRPTLHKVKAVITYTKRMIAVLESSKGISAQPGTTTLSASSR
ncbi:hypothetical protein Cgig2_016769 [Carnegiea gigantea]|uniref:Reverse transcriptase domain-containing protein n=1 Tax=Carnegiea gigantea TaxID=171969 RepID=A0A9Q1GVG9_9CARY|nr:hypothetical protein Cgig2_016769 [Carnegiea gigantea]